MSTLRPLSEALAIPARTFTLPDGQVLQYAVYGDDRSSSKTVFFHHGLPGCHVEGALYHAAALRLGLRIVSVSRPGLALSTPQPGFRVLDWPAKVLALADHLLGTDGRFAVLGVSGGAPYALACLYSLPPERCVGAGTVAGVYPSSLGWAGMALLTRAMFSLAAWSPWLSGKVLARMLGGVVVQQPLGDDDRRRIDELLSGSIRQGAAADRQAWEENEGGIRDVLAEDLIAALERGTDGAAWEFHLAAVGWGFELDDIRLLPTPPMHGRKLVMWHGELDAGWPVAMARGAHMRIAGSELRVAAAAGHVSLWATTVNEVMETMASIME